MRRPRSNNTARRKIVAWSRVRSAWPSVSTDNIGIPSQPIGLPSSPGKNFLELLAPIAESCSHAQFIAAITPILAGRRHPGHSKHIVENDTRIVQKADLKLVVDALRVQGGSAHDGITITDAGADENNEEASEGEDTSETSESDQHDEDELEDEEVHDNENEQDHEDNRGSTDQANDQSEDNSSPIIGDTELATPGSPEQPRRFESAGPPPCDSSHSDIDTEAVQLSYSDLDDTTVSVNNSAARLFDPLTAPLTANISSRKRRRLSPLRDYTVPLSQPHSTPLQSISIAAQLPTIHSMADPSCTNLPTSNMANSSGSPTAHPQGYPSRDLSDPIRRLLEEDTELKSATHAIAHNVQIVHHKMQLMRNALANAYTSHASCKAMILELESAISAPYPNTAHPTPALTAPTSGGAAALAARRQELAAQLARIDQQSADLAAQNQALMDAERAIRSEQERVLAGEHLWRQLCGTVLCEGGPAQWPFGITIQTDDRNDED